MTSTPFTPTQDKTRKNGRSPIANSKGCGTVSVIPSTEIKPNSGPRRTANIARVRESRTISDLCADATFAAQTAAIKKWQARERGRELTLKIAAMLQANVARLEVAPMTMAEEVEQLITGGKKWKNGESVWLTDRVFVKNNSYSISIDVIVSTPAKPFKPPVPCGKIAFMSMQDGQAWKLRNDWQRAVSKAEKLVGVGG